MLMIQDHCAFEFQYAMNVEGNAALEGNQQFLEQSTQEFLTTQTGPLTNWGGDILGQDLLHNVIWDSGLIQLRLREITESIPKGAQSKCSQ